MILLDRIIRRRPVALLARLTDADRVRIAADRDRAARELRDDEEDEK